MRRSRTENTKKNIYTGLIYKLISILLPFLIRTAIIYSLGTEYVGLSSLFTSILQVLNLTELGFSSAMIYNMYKPIAKNDYEKVNALLNYYKKIYHLIGLIMFIIGSALMPFIKHLISGEYPNEINIYVLYIFYLFDSAISYFLFAYKNSLLNALQRNDIINIIQAIIVIIKYTFQLVAIVVFKNFYLFVVGSIIATILINITVAIVSRKKYPQFYCCGNIDKETRKSVREQVSGLMIGKLSDTSRNSFDSIILSAFLGLTIVGIYNNYYYIFTSIYGILLIINNSMQSSVGNSIVDETSEKNYEDMNRFQFIFCFIICFCCCCLIGLYQPFIELWVGKNNLLSDIDMILLCIYFYVLNINNVRNLYFSGNGLWWKAKYSFIFEALFNLVLNLVLGYTLGVTGIILATIITIFIFNFIFRTNILFKEYYKRKPKEFYSKNLRYFIITLILCTIVFYISKSININGVIGIGIRIILCTIIGMLYMLPFIKTKEEKDFIALIKKIIINNKRKK